MNKMGLVTDPKTCWLSACLVFWISHSLAAAATTTPTSSSNGTTNANQALWPDYSWNKNKYNNNPEIYHIPLTYFDVVTDVLAVSTSGYVSFGAEYFGTLPPPTKWPFALKILAVYWTDQEEIFRDPLPAMYTFSDDSRLRNVTTESSLVKYVKKVVGQSEFEPLLVIAVTWVDIRPKLKEKFPNDTATFQLIIATDSRVTYAIRGYQQVWESPELAAQTYYSAAYSVAKGDRLKISTPGIHHEPEVIALGTKQPNKDPYTCVEQALAATIRLNSSLYALPPCPCIKKQAAADQELTILDANNNCYQSKTPPTGSSLLQLCCYNKFGILVNLTKEARVPVSANPNNDGLQGAFEKCCADGSTMCRWFLLNIHRPVCVNNVTVLNTNELPGFPSSDEITYKVSPSSEAKNFRFHFSTSTTAVTYTYSVSTVFNGSHGFSLNTNSFSWDFSQGLLEVRKLLYPQQLVFYATNAEGISVAYSPVFKLCLCEQVEQCNEVSFPLRLHYPPFETGGFIGLDRAEKGNVNMMLCDCKGNATGRYCEKPINPCDDCLIQHRSNCDTNPKDYCPPCVSGYTRDGTQCRGTGGAGNERRIHTSHLCLLIALTFVSSSAPWLQNARTTML